MPFTQFIIIKFWRLNKEFWESIQSTFEIVFEISKVFIFIIIIVFILGWEEMKYSSSTNSKSEVFEPISILISISNCSLLLFFHILIQLLSAVAR